MWKRVWLFVYDSVIFTLLALVVFSLFSYIFKLVMELPPAKLYGAPAPFAKPVRPLPVREDSGLYGVWFTEEWRDWKFHIMPQGAYRADHVTGRSAYEGTWKVGTHDGQLSLIVEEYPVQNPNGKNTITITVSKLRQRKLESDF